MLLLAPLSGCISSGDNGEAIRMNPDTLENDTYIQLNVKNTTVLKDVEALIPDSIEKDTAVPLLIDIHGYTQDMDKHSNLTGFNDIAQEEGFIVVSS